MFAEILQVPSSAALVTELGVVLCLLSFSLIYSSQEGNDKSFNPILIVQNFFKAISKRIYAWNYLLNGLNIIQEGYAKSNGDSFEVLAPDTRMVFVSSPKHIKELDQAPDTVLSLNAASKHMLQPVYTMNGFNWFDKRGTEGIGFVRTLRTLLTNSLPKILPDLGVLNRTRFDELLSKDPLVDGVRHSPVYPMMMKITVLLNAAAIFGMEIAQDEEFQASALAYVEETLLNAEIVKLVPKSLAPLVGGFLSRKLDAQKTFFAKLLPVAEQRIRDRELRSLGHDIPKQADCVQWIMETAPRQKPWSAERIIYELMAIWFGSVHILSTTIVYAIHDMCLHPEYYAPIRQELDTQYAAFERSGQGLPLLDSFMKESTRLTPVESMSVRRCALQPFTLSDGSHLSVGDWACAPSGAIFKSAEHYPAPQEFNGFRFVEPEVLSSIDSETQFKAAQPKPSKFTDVDNSYLMWGTGRMACPGRFYASAFMKIVLAHVVMNYNCALVEPEASRWMSWRSANIPKSKTMVVFTPR